MFARFLVAFLVAVSLSVGLGLLAGPVKEDKPSPLTELLEASVTITVGDSIGSGVVFKNGATTFAWTDAHVVSDGKTITTVINPKTGQPTVRCTFEDVWLIKQVEEGGRKVGEESKLGRIIRFSARHDIAVIQVYKKSWLKNGVTFATEKDIPSQGETIWHIGAICGMRGSSSVSDGVFAAAGRLRRSFKHEETLDPVIYDQVSLNAVHPGCSGGGVFRKSDGKCLGLITEFIRKESYGAACMTPARRLREFARDAHCEYALDDKVEIPVSDSEPVMQDDITLPKEWLPPAPAPAPATLPIPLPVFPVGPAS